VVKLIYFKERRAELESSCNPFAFVTLAQLEVNESDRQLKNHRSGADERRQQRYRVKKRLILLLLDRNFDRSEILALLKFLDWLLNLPEGLERQLTGELEKERGGETMAYVTSWERIARKDGIIEGKIEERREVLIRQLDKKFHISPEEKTRIAAAADPDKLDKALDAILFAETKEEVLRELD
jgi:hypothetical protein